jgi:hypothetical protein
MAHHHPRITGFASAFILALILLPAELHADETIVLPQGRFQVDHSLHLIVTDLSVDWVNSQWPGLKTAVQADEAYDLAPALATVALGTDIALTDGMGTPYHLYFTALPLISITTTAPIVDEPQVLGWFVLSDGSGTITSADLGIEYRGSSTQNWPKKSYRMEFRTDSTGTQNLDVSLLGLRSDDDWNLLAQYNEPMRARNPVANALWRSIHAPYYQNLEPAAINGVRMKHTEVFVNGAYQGIYALSEPLDRKQLKLKKYDQAIRGELYKGYTWGASTFSYAPPYDNNSMTWGGFELEYPEEVIDWSSLHDFVDFVVNAPEADFLADYASRFVVSNAVDYFIFLNLLRATDNTGKNIYLARYDSGTPYFYAPTDLDGCFGVIWDGSPEDTTNDVLLNGFYERLMHDCGDGGFVAQVQQRWNALRTDLLTQGHIMGLFAQEVEELDTNGAYARESMAWPDYAYDPAQMDYLGNWLSARLTFLDSLFNAPCVPSGIDRIATRALTIYPNPATDLVHIELPRAGASAQISVKDLLGRPVRETTSIRDRGILEVHGLPMDGAVIQRKLVIK